MTLSAQERRRGLIALLIIIFLMFCGFFMVVPLVTVHYVDNLGFAAAAVGLALAMRQLVQQGSTLFGGMLADRFGVRRLIGIGVLIRALGFISLAWATTPVLLFWAMLLSAVGGALFDAPSRAAIAALTTSEERARFYSITSVISSVAMSIGPLLGALLLRLDFGMVCFAAAACFLLTFLVTWLFLPAVQVAAEQQEFSYGLRLVARDRPFILLTALLMGYWFMWVQLMISLPLVAVELSGSNDSIGLIYTLNAGLTIALQYPLLRLAERWLRPLPILVLGLTFMALGLGVIALVQSFPALLICIVLFAIGVLLAAPTQQTVTAALADPRALGTYFGVSSMALAFGGGIGNFVGGWLFDLARLLNWPALPWIIFCTAGLICAAGLSLMGMRKRFVAREPVVHSR
ncbi:MAG: MFS transporter [Chloroflexales bacterium]|nr:MFS transporter [Chloroflexales bacterium]